LHAGVDDGDCRVAPGSLEGEEQRQWPADGESPADHHRMASLDGNVVGVQQFEDARRRARQRSPGHAVDQAPEVDRVQAVDVLVRIDGEQRQPPRRGPSRQGHLDQERIDGQDPR
jgi:hypothetical protein